MVDMMIRTLMQIWGWGMLVVIAWYSQTADAQLVRKKYEPSFFVPQGEFEEKPREIPLVKYRYGEIDSVSHKERAKSVRKIVPQPEVAQVNTPPINNKQVEIPDGNISATPEVPEYQQVYQEYLKDVDKVAKGRKMPANRGLQNDLAKMDSDERIKIDKEFNANRDVMTDFSNALNY